MARGPRDKSPTGLYHITMRGNGKRILFETDEDRMFFMNTTRNTLDRENIELVAWCLMGNHIHLAIYDPKDNLSDAFKVIAGTYAIRYNNKTGHTGHVFQDRFGTQPIKSDTHLLQAIRYIHNNPQKAQIGSRETYPWSSHHQYAGVINERSFVKNTIIDKLFPTTEHYERFMAESSDSYYSPPGAKRLAPEEALERGKSIARKIGGCDLSEVAGLPKPLRNKVLKAMRAADISIREIQRLTEVGEWTIRKATP